VADEPARPDGAGRARDAACRRVSPMTTPAAILVVARLVMASSSSFGATPGSHPTVREPARIRARRAASQPVARRASRGSSSAPPQRQRSVRHREPSAPPPSPDRTLT
jgi:hypothetical protein